MERTIDYEGRPWRVWVTPAPGADSGLELVFMEERAHGQKLGWPVGPDLLRSLSREALEVDASLLREALRSALEARRPPGGPPASGGPGAA